MKSNKEIVKKIIPMIIVGFLLLFILIGVTGFFLFFNIGIFEILGVEYESWTSILLFFGFSLVADAVINGVVVFFKASYFHRTGRSVKKQHASIFRILLDFMAIHIIDELMTSVHFSILSKIGFVLIIYLIDASIFSSRNRESDKPRDE
ncbi:YrvL family regulatory protein [Paenibacillus apiarius]|uniref:Regulatory YrvL family protein n=1 Tax=Paenibacillus apiarius TaxID=46240 RepID=A0ABT4E1T2_9BACL|nr:YrvL family regulatory protein [Paenibacillus apiarius]MCY9517965.1 regulatory YrvL family protein [Paenibacillus apiarius]MCY9523566.1 regulatory YrvL family protein [Paenibacillus apiarius]MCY9555423.1 regulatory YrvL family protein [Paenibacillus apiarius]MCY9561497.1 regulatory YrvL family protein [Paenibacillus apiarius]MCY9684272.1 regulatory YrvL family protein [Paenibacillus apiarius]